MRGYASLAVVFLHLFTISSVMRAMGFPSLILSWNSGVDFFFVLSGFLLSVPFMGSGKVNLRAYYVKRVFRIFPVYYLSICICGSVLLFLNYATLQQILASMFFVQSFSPSTFNTINGVSWTLVIEEIFYATLPIFAILFVKERWRYSLPVCLAASIAYRVAVVQLYPINEVAFHLWQYPSFLGHYAIGVTLASFYANRKMRVAKFNSSFPSLIAVTSLLVSQYLIGSVYSISNNKAAFPGVLFALEYGALINFVLTSPTASRVRSAFTNRVAISAGKISYSTYTWHLPIEVGLYQLGLPALAWAAISIALVLSVASWSFRNLETPILELRNRFLPAKGLGISPVRVGK